MGESGKNVCIKKNVIAVKGTEKTKKEKKKKKESKKIKLKKQQLKLEVRGFEPRTSRMQSERSTTELHPHAREYSEISQVC